MMEGTSILLLSHAGATLLLTGLIWFVQLVHYPLFSGVGEDGFKKYHDGHTRLTGRLVAPLMLFELFTGIGLTWARPGSISVWLGIGLIVMIWISTFLILVPRHRQLTRGYRFEAHRALITTNWIRTIGWTCRSLLVLWMTGQL